MRHRTPARRALSVSAATAVACLTLGIASVTGAKAVGPPTTPPGFVPEKWATAIVKRTYEVTPSIDRSCQASQSRALWLLGFQAVPKNGIIDCRIPAGTPIFVAGPWIECSNVEPWPFFGANDRQLRVCVEGLWRRHFRSAAFFIDGEKVPSLGRAFVRSDGFDLDLPAGNPLGAPAGRARSMVKGVFLYIAPLAPGTHDVIATADLGAFGQGQAHWRIVVG